MNILMISHYAGAPQYGMEFRSFYMAREWVRMGHQVCIVGASFSHLRHRQPSAASEVIDGIRYHWLPTRSYQGNGMARVMTMFQFVIQVYRRMKEWVQFQPDVVIASSVYTFDIYPCHRIAYKTGARLVYEVHDLWPLSPMIIGGYSRRHPFIWLLQRGEDYAYHHCDKVVSIIDKAYPHMQRHGLTEEKFCCIPNGFLREEWDSGCQKPLPDSHRLLLQHLHDEGKVVVGFAGGHTQSTALHILIDAARQLQQHEQLVFVLVGQGPQKDELMSMAQRDRLTNVHFLSPVEKRQIPSLLQLFDIGYAGGVHSPLHQYGTSFNKVTDYMMAGIPVLFSVDEPHSLVERVGCGMQVEAENPQQVGNALMTLAQMSQEARAEMGTKGRTYALSHLEYRTLSQHFLEEIATRK